MKPTVFLLGFIAQCFFFQSALAETSVHAFGFILPNWIGVTSGVESFSQANSSAYTAAGNPVFRKGPYDGQSSFQVAQSRIGIKLEKSKDLTATLEMDFIDFTKSSPTTASNPRLRQAFVQWSDESSDWTFKIGQMWDLVSPLGPFDYNFVGHYFESGDIGFMRNQVMVLKKDGNLEHGMAIGLPTQNSTSSAGSVEMTVLPTLALRETWSPSTQLKAGASALVSSLRADSYDPKRIFAGAFTLFAELNHEKFKVNSEAYFGQNTYNLGMLGLAFGDLTHPRVQEAGAYLSFKAVLTEKSNIFGGFGMSVVLNPNQMPSSYTRASATSVSLAGTGPGIERNSTIRLGYDHQIIEGLTGFVQGALLISQHHLLTQDVETHSPNQFASLLNTGVIFNF